LSSNAADRPKVSVVITTKNRLALLREAIASVHSARSERYELELIVVDDGSTDGTLEYLASSEVKVVRAGGVGMARARNQGLNAATGDFVTLLDDDDVWLPNNVVDHLAVFDQHPEYGAVLGQAQLAEADGAPFGSPQPGGPLASGWIFEDILTYYPQVATILTRASVAREAGDMDPTLTGDTDWDWILRVAWKHPIGRFEKPVMLFRQRGMPHEELAWRRYPATSKVFLRHVQKLPLRKRLALTRVFWKHRGRWSADFLRFARERLASGERQRALRCLYYAFRASPVHTAMNVVRDPLRFR
jgi:glycosyltransferase involved in cell wall biosynthesis